VICAKQYVGMNVVMRAVFRNFGGILDLVITHHPSSIYVQDQARSFQTQTSSDVAVYVCVFFSDVIFILYAGGLDSAAAGCPHE
jgi:hypothetical protein